MSFSSRVLSLASVLTAAAPAFADGVISSGNLPIHDVATSGKGEEVKQLLKANPSLLNVRNVRGATPLHFAAINPDPSVMQALLDAGADVNAKDEDGTTPLHMTAFSRRSQYSLVLMEAGADVNATMTSGRTPLALADKSRADEVAGVISLWILKGCKGGQGCAVGTARAVGKLVK